jgi:hypothetical protein
MIGSIHVSQLNKFANKSRNEYAERTLPWDDMGDRLLTTSVLLPFKADFNGKRTSSVDAAIISVPTTKS